METGVQIFTPADLCFIAGFVALNLAVGIVGGIVSENGLPKIHHKNNIKRAVERNIELGIENDLSRM